MSPSFGHDGQEPSSSHSGRRPYTPPAILNELRHLDLTGRFSLEDLRVIGRGTHGDMLKATCNLEGRETIVAVKRLRFYLKEDINTLFTKEIYVWSRLKHANILSLSGYAFDESSGYPLLVSEWMVNGSSWDYVKNGSNCDLIHLVSGIAEGLAYLHENNVVHSDIKPDNVVVTDTGSARICDFGGSRIAAASKSIAKPSTGVRGTPCYLSYELVALPDQYPQHTKESDVWAFGMTIYALISQEHPFALYGDAQVLKAIADREVPSFNFWTSRSSKEKATFRNICHLCWDHDPKCRAIMSVIVSSLRDSVKHRNVSRPLDMDHSERGDAKRQRVLSSVEDISSDNSLTTNSIGDVKLNDNEGLYRPLFKVSSNLDALCGFVDSQSNAYQYLHAAINVSSSLCDVFVKDFKIDGKLDHLIRAMADLLTLTTAIPNTMNQRDGERSLIRLLQQIIECCIFIDKYSRKSYEDRKLNTGDGRRMTELISFFVIFKEALELRTGGLPAFASSRAAQREAIDESVLRQRLNPNETDMKDQQRCLLGTRVEVQQQIIKWTLSTSSNSILWLHGVAGSGKSTVITSIAEHFRGIYRLGAFLRFTRGISEPSSVISTIAFKLALFDSTIGSLILAETNRDKDIVNASLTTQFEKLLLDPLTISENAQLGPVVVILDALDECGTSASRRSMIQVFLHGIRRLPLNFKFLITSRREQDIDRTFNTYPSGSVILVELDYKSHLSCSDVQTYLTHEIRKITDGEDIPGDGSFEKQLSIIGDTAAGLFVFASTIIKLVSEYDSPLEKLTEISSNVRSLGGLDQLYSTVLGQSGISWHDNTSKNRFQRVIGLILLSKTPLTEDMIDAILGPSVGKCRAILSRLRSVIDYKPGEPIRLFHISFSDYLMSSDHADHWFIGVIAQESFLAMRCFKIMKEALRFNICDFKSSFVQNDMVDNIEDRIKLRISPHISYACSYWYQHLCKTPYGLALAEGLSTFMYGHLLYWLEVMSLLKKVSGIGPAFLATIKWIGNNDTETTAFIRDARRLLNIFALPISQSVPHIYLSMLPLTATESKVSAHYLQHTSSLVRVFRRGVKSRSPLLKLLEGHTGSVSSVDFSPDGSLIASGYNDGTVRIWDTERGEPVAGPFEGRVGSVDFVTFLPDGARIVVGGESISVLDIENGNTIVGPFGDINCLPIAVSPDGKHVVSTATYSFAVSESYDGVDIWELEGGTFVGKINTDSVVTSIVYSHDGCLIFTVLQDDEGDIVVCGWDAESRKLVRKHWVTNAISYLRLGISPDGNIYIWDDDTGSIRIWDMKTEGLNSDSEYETEGLNSDSEYETKELNSGLKYSNFVTSVAYSSKNSQIAAGLFGNTVVVWNSEDGQLISGPFIHPNEVLCIAFSPDGTRVVSGSKDRTIRIWDAESGKIASGPKLVKGLGAIRFSMDCSCVISDEGTTWHVKDGEVTTFKDSGEREQQQTIAITKNMRFKFSGIFRWRPYYGFANPFNGYYYRIAISPNGKRFAFGSCYSGSIRIWDKEHDKLICRPFSGQGGHILSLTFSPDGSRIAYWSDSLRIRDAETGKLLFGPFCIELARYYYVSPCRFSPDGRHVALGFMDNTVRIWDIETGHSQIFRGHKRSVRSVCFSPDGSRIVSRSYDDEIRIWSTIDSEVIAPTDLNHLLESSRINITTWILDQDGWIRGVHGELLLWVPLDLRKTLCYPRNTAVLNVEFSTELDFEGSALGERWHECFHPPS